MSSDVLLAAQGVSKAYGTPVLSNVDLQIHAGQVHALLGANGAGKSTLVSLLCGLERPDAGRLTLGGAPYAPRSRRDAEQAGVQLVLQELNLVETLSVAENLRLPRLPRRFGFVDRRRLHADARRALATVELEDVPPDTLVGGLGVGQRQLVEIARALSQDCRVLVLDEPTAALTATEAARLFAHVARLRAEGIGILYISHRLREVRQLADRITVLRDGVVVANGIAAGVDDETLVGWMAGRTSPVAGAGDLAASAPPRRASTGAPVALRVEGLTRRGALDQVSFDVHRGEILGLAGLVGAGRTETLRAIVGADPIDSGRVTRGAERQLVVRSPRDAARAGIGLVPEDRKAQGLLLTQSVRSNTALGSERRLFASRAGWIDATAEATAVAASVARLDVRCASIEQPVAELSGGNQQKVVLARWLLRDVDVLLVDEPTRGIDVASKAAIHERLRDLAAQGRALVIVSSELDELMALCDRIVVLSAGRVTGTFARDAWSEAAILAAAFAAPAGQAAS